MVTTDKLQINQTIFMLTILNELRKMGPFPKPDDLNRLLPWSNELPEGFRTKEYYTLHPEAVDILLAKILNFQSPF